MFFTYDEKLLPKLRSFISVRSESVLNSFPGRSILRLLRGSHSVGMQSVFRIIDWICYHTRGFTRGARAGIGCFHA